MSNDLQLWHITESIRFTKTFKTSNCLQCNNGEVDFPKIKVFAYVNWEQVGANKFC